MKIVKYLGYMLVAIVALLAFGFIGKTTYDRQIDYDVDLAGTAIPKFTEIDVPFYQIYNATESLPFVAGAAIDVDGDGTEELFLGGGRGQPDGLFRFEGGKFIAINNAGGITKPDDALSHGSVVLDVNGDGTEDLIVAREGGLWLHTNDDGIFSSHKLDAPLREDTTPLSVAVGDINGDGHFDMYVSGYIRNDLVEGQNIFNKEGYGGTSALFINRGDNTFENKTTEAGLHYKHNTFQAVFIDVDRDNDLDLVVAHDTGQVRTWQNDGSGKFSNLDNPTSKFFTYPMGIAVADYDQNGLVDFFFSNVGSTPPNFLLRGDLRDDQINNWKWMLFNNNGGFQFKDVAHDAKLADYEFSWGAVFSDLNLDGREDLIVSENYIGLPLHKLEFLRLPGRVLVQTPSGKFAAVGAEAGVVNKHYSISPITADFNGDGYPDIVHVNLSGRSKAFFSKAGDNGYLKVKLPATVGSIGAIVKVSLDDGRDITKFYVSGEGLCSDSSRMITVGLGKSNNATTVSVTYINGTTDQKNGSFRNEVVSF
ncbi:MAG: FG-GAP repeat domain-containing protein [Hyphomicrobiaceae bacterium]